MAISRARSVNGSRHPTPRPISSRSPHNPHLIERRVAAPKEGRTSEGDSLAIATTDERRPRLPAVD